MGQYDGFEFEDGGNGNGTETGGDLRKARDAAAKKASDLEVKVTELTKQLTERNLKDVLQKKDLNPGLAKWMSNDGIDGSDESKVDTWLTENALLIGYTPKPSEEPEVPDARQVEFARMQNTTANALPAGKLTEAISAVNKAEGIDAMNAALRQAAQAG